MRAILAMLCAAAVGVLTWAFGPALAQTTFPNPVVTQTTLTGAAALIIAANPTRRSIRICNVGATNAIWVWPGALSPPKSAEILAPVASNVSKCIEPPAGVVGSNGAQWNAVITGGSTGSVSVEEW